MASTNDYRDLVMESLCFLGTIYYKPMMGEFLLYYKGVLFGGIYDDRFLVKKVSTNEKYGMQEEIPYDGAKAMYLVEDIDNRELLREIVLDTYEGLEADKNE